MSTTKHTTDTTPGPNTDTWSRDQILQAFVDLVNAIEPRHYYAFQPDQHCDYGDGAIDDIYPIETSDIETKVNCGSNWASCGPYQWGNTFAVFGMNGRKLTEMEPAQLLAILVHEATHLVEGNHTEGSIHNKAFWREYAFLALETRDALRDGVLPQWPADEAFVQEFLARVVWDARPVVLDQRQWSQDEARRQMAEWIGVEDCRFTPDE